MQQIVVSNLPPEISELKLGWIFGRYGDVHSVRLAEVSDLAPQAIVEMRPRDADRAIEGLARLQVHGRRIQLTPGGASS